MEGIYFVSIVFEVAIALACAIFIALLLVTRTLPKQVTRFGVLLFLNLSFIALFYLLINIGWINVALPLLWLFVPSTITVGLFFYRFNTTWLDYRFRIDKYLNLVPIVILIVAAAIEILNYTSPENESIHTIRVGFTTYTLSILFPLYSGMLILLNFLKLRRAEKLNQEVYASKDLVNLNWSRISLGFYVIFYLGIILSELVNPFVSELIFNISILMLVLYLGYYQINTISRYLSIAHDRIENNNQEEVVQEKTSVDDSKSNELFNAIDDLVESEQLFLKFDVSIHELGKRLEMNSKYLSQAINNQDGLNFNRFINAKRVRHASVLIQDEQFNNYSLEGIAKESGFRSKSTFNTTFKGIMGCTPSEYKKGKH